MEEDDRKGLLLSSFFGENVDYEPCEESVADIRAFTYSLTLKTGTEEYPIYLYHMGCGEYLLNFAGQFFRPVGTVDYKGVIQAELNYRAMKSQNPHMAW